MATRSGTESNGSATIFSNVQTSAFPGALPAATLIQLICIVVDRIAYLLRSLHLKFVIHAFNMCYWYYYCFIGWLTITGIMNGYIIFFTLTKTIVFVMSSYQIFYGYYPDFVASFPRFTSRTDGSYLWYLMHQIYKSVPFLPEIRITLDWLCLSTTLSFEEHKTLEDIYDNAYRVQYLTMYERSWRHRGMRTPIIKKLSTVPIFLVAVLIVWFPMYVFSAGNSEASPNLALSAKYMLTVESANTQMQLTATASTQTLDVINENMYTQMKQAGVIEDQLMSNIQICQMVEEGSLFVASPPQVNRLMQLLKNKKEEATIKLTFEFTRKNSAPSKGYNSVVLGDQQRDELYQMLNASLGDSVYGNSAKETEGVLTKNSSISEASTVSFAPVAVAGLDPLFLRVPKVGSPIQLTASDSYSAGETLGGENFTEQLTTYLDFITYFNANGQVSQWWKVTVKPPWAPDTTSGVLYFLVSDPVSALTFGETSVIGMYILIIVTVGGMVRGMFTGLVPQIVYTRVQDMECIVAFCKGIYFARYKKDPAKEELLFRRLIYIYRSPEIMLNLTKRPRLPPANWLDDAGDSPGDDPPPPYNDNGGWDGKKTLRRRKVTNGTIAAPPQK